MKDGPEKFILTDEGDVNKFLGIEISQIDNSSFELSQPFLIDRIVTFLGLSNNEFDTDANPSSTPVAKGLLHRNLAGKLRKLSWKYRNALLPAGPYATRNLDGGTSDCSFFELPKTLS